MRMLPTRYISGAKPIRVKKQPAKVNHLTAPLRGLDLSTKLSGNAGGTDALTAPILKNFVIQENRIECRPGTAIVATHSAHQPIETIIPYFGALEAIAVATHGEVCFAPAMTVLKNGFTSNAWSWTSYANLGVKTYTVMCNGKEGVWSWDGTNLPAGLVKETITAPASAAWVDPNKLSIVMAHQNFLFFADDQNLCVYYLPLQTKSGELKMLPLNAMFRRGGTVRAVYSWTIDGGAGMDDMLVIFSSNGECAIYKGTDPDSDYSLVGVFRFDSPLSKGSITQYGGDLYVMISTGMVPLSTMLKAQNEQLGIYDRNIASIFQDLASKYRNIPGWALMMDSSTNRIICNMPMGAPNKYRQVVREMLDPSWTQWDDIPSRCWIWLGNKNYFGDDSGNLWQMSKTFLNDGGKPIQVDVQWAWSDYGSPAFKQFKMVRPYILTDGVPAPFVDMRADYDQTPPRNQPDISFTRSGSKWNVSKWDTSPWAQGEITIAIWNGVSASGRVAAPRISAAINNCSFAISGIDVIYEVGSIMG